MEVIVNGTKHEFAGKPGREVVTCEMIVALAGYVMDGFWTVTYKDKHRYACGVTLRQGGTVILDEGACFNVAYTGRA